ncbi:hypothetical protein CRG98_044522 [Punica granatum]|uniref:RNase H type-1 domain-containing protein n=1 Tax=Punica granatum TaxID=22663 RepID=A0A2I0HTP2_PUNGR|nr:hypothetical protein CRG98_044522 [Punica granatum]
MANFLRMSRGREEASVGQVCGHYVAQDPRLYYMLFGTVASWLLRGNNWSRAICNRSSFPIAKINGKRETFLCAGIIFKAASGFASTNLPHPPTVLRELKNIGWRKPFHEWSKLNTDGAAKGNPGKAGTGGLIRDEFGRWVGGYAHNIGITMSMVAELWAVKTGLELAWDFLNQEVNTRGGLGGRLSSRALIVIK